MFKKHCFSLTLNCPEGKLRPREGKACLRTHSRCDPLSLHLVQAEEPRGQVASRVTSPPFARAPLPPETLPPSPGRDRWFRPQSDPPVLSQPGGASERVSPGGHLPPTPASQLPLPWQQLDSRSQGKAPPGSAQHSQTSEGETQRDRGPEWLPAEGLGEVGMRGRELDPESRTDSGATERGTGTKRGEHERQEGRRTERQRPKREKPARERRAGKTGEGGSAE